MTDRYLFDTYALVSLIQDRQSYRHFADSIILTTHYNLIELYYAVLRDYDEKTAKAVYRQFQNCVISVSDEIIFKAMAFRFKMKRSQPKCNLSYVDCIGYECARTHKIPFVTGDKEFQGFDGVEFVK